MNCWHEFGSPLIRNAKTERAAQLADAVYETCLVGGRLHIVLDDWNIDDQSIKFCQDMAELNASERECIELLAAMSFPERASALAIHSGFNAEDAQPWTENEDMETR